MLEGETKTFSAMYGKNIDFAEKVGFGPKVAQHATFYKAGQAYQLNERKLLIGVLDDVCVNIKPTNDTFFANLYEDIDDFSIRAPNIDRGSRDDMVRIATFSGEEGAMGEGGTPYKKQSWIRGMFGANK